MPNGKVPETDREWLIEIAGDVKNILEDQKLMLKRVDNYGKRISEVETEQVRHEGKFILGNEKFESLEEDIDAKPSAGKIIIWMVGIVSIITTLGIFAIKFVK